MIWYLLYPFRGTTEPPVLAANHPLRRAFYRYGYTAARHWLAFILLSVALAVFLCYPVFFLYENPTTGFSKLPLHVWTSARLYDGNQNVEPDIVIRQVWVHGNYMGALEKDVLLEALHIQNILVPQSAANLARREGLDSGVPEIPEDVTDGDFCSTKSSDFKLWGFHSPLMFWNCSGAAIRDDDNVVATIDSQTHRHSYLNLTLRPTSVLAGKSFVNDKVVAADALVLTMFGRHNLSSSQTWDQCIEQISAESQQRGNSLYPRGGHVQQSRLYEFQQKPMSFQDNFFLFITYLLMGLYVIVSLGKLRAVKSWAGLLITVMFETALSITASFSVCGLLKIDLARVPDAAYPFVVLVMGLENMFRLTNAVLAQKPELPVVQRIATALSEVGHLALATAAQMLFVLWLLAKVAPGIAPFCAFAALALSFDFAFHLTFFLAVLSVDVRRLELQDSLDRAKNGPPARRQSAVRQERQYWLDALLQGRLPFSSRIAGSAASICFMLALNMHFYESGNSLRSLLWSVRSMFTSQRDRYSTQFIAPPINQARTPAAWLRIQDYRYAQEVLRYVKPTAHSIIARVYDPLVIVMSGSDRNGQPLRDDSFFALLWSLFRKHLYPFLLAIIFSVAFVTLLMQYLLWNELPEEDDDADCLHPSPMAVESVPKSHRLDVIQIAACAKGHIVSISLDRLITFSMLDQRTHMYSLSSTLATAMTPPVWPIAAVTIDDNGQWAALCSYDGIVIFWNMAERRLSHTIQVELNDERPILFELASIHHGEDDQLFLILITPLGQLRIIDPFKEDIVLAVDISREKLAIASIIRSRPVETMVALTKSGKVRFITQVDGVWSTIAVEKFDPRFGPSSQEGVIKGVYTVAPLHMVAAVRLRVVDLIDITTKTLVHSFSAILVRGHSLRVLHGPVRQCKACNAVAVHSLSIAYTDFESQSAVLRTYTISDDHNDLICVGPRLSARKSVCRTLSHAKEQVFTVDHPGSWEATNSQALVGIRLRATGSDTPHSAISTASGLDAPQFNLQTFETVKKRNFAEQAPRFGSLLSLEANTQTAQHETDDWEVWTLSSTGEHHIASLHSAASNQHDKSIGGDDELLIAAPGPIVRLTQRSVVVGFGNRVKVVRVGAERLMQDISADYQDLAQQAPSSARRRKPVGKRAA